MARRRVCHPGPLRLFGYTPTARSCSACSRSCPTPGLLDSFQYHLSCPTDRRSRVGVLQFVPGQSERSFLLSPLGVRVRTGLNLKDQGLAADRVCAGIAEASLYRSFVFFRRALLTVVGHKFGTAWTGEQISKAAIAIEDNEAFRGGTHRLGLGTVPCDVKCDPRPGSYAVFGGLVDGVARRQRHCQ